MKAACIFPASSAASYLKRFKRALLANLFQATGHRRSQNQARELKLQNNYIKGSMQEKKDYYMIIGSINSPFPKLQIFLFMPSLFYVVLVKNITRTSMI